MKIKTSEATPLQVNWLVAKCEGAVGANDRLPWYTPSTDWAQGGPIIEREELSVEPLYTAGGLDCWQAFGHNLRYDDHGNYIQGSDNRQYAPTPLIAALRCYVASKLGDEVEIPEELK